MKKHNIFKATALIFGLTLAAKMLGFVKSMIQASYFGASLEMDVYNVSSNFVSNILYMLTHAISAAFLPLYIRHEREKRKQFASRTITTLTLFSCGVSLLLFLAAPLVIRIIAPSYTGENALTAERYFRFLLIGIPLSLMINMFSSVLNSERRYGYSSLHSIINSLVLILVIVLFSHKLGIWALVICMPTALLIEWIVLYPIARRYTSFSLKRDDEEDKLKVLLLQAVPVLLSLATVEVNQVVDRALLSSLEQGSVTAVSYSAVLYQFVSSIISAPMSTVLFTELSEAGAKNDPARSRQLLLNGVKAYCMICLPIILVTLFSCKDVVSIVYGRGKFGADAIIKCAEGLQMYILCLLPACIKGLFNRAFFSHGDTKRPMIRSILEVMLNIGLSVLLVKRFGIMGVVGATAIASTCAALANIIVFQHKYHKVFSAKHLLSYWKLILSCVLTAAVLFLLRSLPLSALLSFVIKTAAGFAVFFVPLLLLREEALTQVLTMLRDKIAGRKNRKKPD